jgi:hypothetical protein
MNTKNLHRVTGLVAITGLLITTGVLNALGSYFSTTTVSGCTNSGYANQAGYGYGYMITCPTGSASGGGGSYNYNSNSNSTTINTDGMTMADVHYGVVASAMEKTNPGYFAKRNAYLAKTFAAQGVRKISAIRRELNKNSEFTTTTTLRAHRTKLVNTLYKLIKAIK